MKSEFKEELEGIRQEINVIKKDQELILNGTKEIKQRLDEARVEDMLTKTSQIEEQQKTMDLLLTHKGISYKDALKFNQPHLVPDLVDWPVNTLTQMDVLEAQVKNNMVFRKQLGMYFQKMGKTNDKDRTHEFRVLFHDSLLDKYCVKGSAEKRSIIKSPVMQVLGGNIRFV